MERMININHIDLGCLDKYEHQISNLDKKTFRKVEKYKTYILKSVNEDYKYGSSWLDLFILEKQIRRFEKFLHKYSINIVILNNV
jgi:hypothetical protein